MSHDELRKLAEAATPGPWWTDEKDKRRSPALPSPFVVYSHDGHVVQADWAANPDADLAFIAAANPQTVLSLLDQLAAANALIAKLEQLVCDFQAAAMIDVGNQGGPCRVEPRHVEVEITRLRASIAALVKAGNLMHDICACKGAGRFIGGTTVDCPHCAAWRKAKEGA